MYIEVAGHLWVSDETTHSSECYLWHEKPSSNLDATHYTAVDLQELVKFCSCCMPGIIHFDQEESMMIEQ